MHCLHYVIICLKVRAKASAISATAYICNMREHWFTIRRLGSQWFNLNSLLEGPELVGGGGGMEVK